MFFNLSHNSNLTPTLYHSSTDMTMKFPNGIMIQTRAVSYSVAITTAWGSAYESAQIDLGNWHESFAEVPVMNINAKTNTSVSYLTIAKHQPGNAD